MILVGYKASFLRQLKSLEEDLQEEVMERIKIFETNPKNPTLRTHKLKGHLKGKWSFSVNYRYRIVFQYEDTKTVALLDVGDHDVYK